MTDYDQVLDALVGECKCPPEKFVLETCNKVIEILQNTPNVVSVSAPVSVRPYAAHTCLSRYVVTFTDSFMT